MPHRLAVGHGWSGGEDPSSAPVHDGNREATGVERVVTGTVTFDLLLGDVHSLKEKRSYVRPIVAELRRRFAVAAAETGALDRHRRAEIGVAVVAADGAHCHEVLDQCERLVAGRPEVELLATRRRLYDEDD